VLEGPKFFIECGLGGDEPSIAVVLIKISLAMSANYHTPVDYWLGLTLPSLCDWTATAQQMVDEEKQRHNVQRIGPGL
jgi:hypothetical protein